jgi:hypothetical protein
VPVAEIGQVVNAPRHERGVAEVGLRGVFGACGVADGDERQAGLLQPAHPAVLQRDLHQDDPIDPPTADVPLEGSVVVTAGRREKDVEVGAGRGLDHAGDEAQLPVRQSQAGRGMTGPRVRVRPCFRARAATLGR